MNTDESDKRLRRLFDEWQRQDTENTPAFGRIWDAAASRKPAPRPTPWLRLAAAALVVVGASLAVVQVSMRQPAAATPWSSLSNWQASTDVLLTVSSAPWGTQVAVPSDSWIDTGVSGSETTQQNRKETR